MQEEQLLRNALDPLRAQRHGGRGARIEDDEVGLAADLQGPDAVRKAERNGVAPRDPVERRQRVQALTPQLHDLVGFVQGLQLRVAGAGADVGRNRRNDASPSQPGGVEQAGAEEQVGGRAEHGARLDSTIRAISRGVR